MQKKLIAPFVSVAAMIMAAPAAMAQDDVREGFSPRATVGVEHDSNVLRLPSASGPKGDTVLNVGVGLSFNKRYGLQRIRAEVDANTYRYADQSSLNYNTINYALAWDWSITQRFHGVVSAERRQYREVTSDPLFLTNLVGRRTERTELAEGIFEVAGPWRVLAGVQHTKAESSQPRSYDASPDINQYHVGVGYEFASGSNISARLRKGDGEYTDPSFIVANRDFEDREAELALHWELTGKTRVDARIAHRKREHSGAPGLDFSGMVGNATVAWDITGKTRLVAGAMRDISATGIATGGHVVSDRIFIGPKWQATGKTSLYARWDHIKRDWDGIPFASPSYGRSETIDTAQIGADWEALRTITVSPYIRYERMKSSVSSGYRANVYGVAAKASF